MGSPVTLSLTDIDIVRGDRLLISNLTLKLAGPKLLWVAGVNGIGKTSLLRTCAGLIRPASGTVNWIISEKQMSAPEAIAFLPSAPYSKSGMTAGEDAKFWNAALNSVDIAPHEKTKTEKLSTGQSKRLSFAKMIAANKPIWILDEPLAGLDKNGRAMIASHLQTHVKNGGLALVASHAPITVDDIPTQRLTLG